jgi:hypothetical protein
MVEGCFPMGRESRGQGQGHRCATQELAEEVQGRAPLLLAARLARIRPGLALSERPCVALAGTEGRVELTTESLVLGL